MNQLISKLKLTGIPRYLASRAYMRAIARTGPAAKTIRGRQVSLNLADAEQRYMYRDCIREPENAIIYMAMAKHGLADTFIDIGANCGHVALSIIDCYSSILLYEPNPVLASLLREIFYCSNNVQIKEKAIVGSSAVSEVKLFVPFNSSGLATVVGTHLNNSSSAQEYSVAATTLSAEFGDKSLANAYIKIDVEGQEYDILSSSQELFNLHRPIVGFEALTTELLAKCASIFENCHFYCSRFDFLEPGGSLVKSPYGLLKALVFGGSIDVLKVDPGSAGSLSNFSQVYAVPNEKRQCFENAIQDSFAKCSPLNLASMEDISALAWKA
jgi:FkbM family methyltransferase